MSPVSLMPYQKGPYPTALATPLDQIPLTLEDMIRLKNDLTVAILRATGELDTMTKELFGECQ